MEDCIFCKIINKEIGANIVYEDEYVLAFKDLNPVANVHVLVIPKVHIESVNEINEQNSDNIQKVFEAISKIATKLNIAVDGYRLVINTGVNGGQTVKHFHVHLIGGEKLPEKMI